MIVDIKMNVKEEKMMMNVNYLMMMNYVIK